MEYYHHSRLQSLWIFLLFRPSCAKEEFWEQLISYPDLTWYTWPWKIWLGYNRNFLPYFEASVVDSVVNEKSSDVERVIGADVAVTFSSAKKIKKVKFNV